MNGSFGWRPEGWKVYAVVSLRNEDLQLGRGSGNGEGWWADRSQRPESPGCAIDMREAMNGRVTVTECSSEVAVFFPRGM